VSDRTTNLRADAATDVDRAVREAAASGLELAARDDRARWLTAIADALEAARDELVAIARDRWTRG
jgi:NADP-dependent aldehyde dehydrogenase